MLKESLASLYSCVNNTKPFSQESANKLNYFHKEKISKRKLPIDEILDKALWVQSVKRVALLLYRVCQSYKTWSAEIGQDWIAKQLKLSRVTVNQAIKKLERYELIRVFRRGLGLTHTYQFNIPHWLERILNKLPANKHCKRQQVLNELTLSNQDLNTYKEYTEVKDSKDERIRIFKINNPEKAKETDKKYTQEDIWSPSHEMYKAPNIYKASKEVAKGYLDKVKSLFR